MTEIEQNLFVRKEIVVDVPQDFAFTTYADNMGAWWPRDHHIGEADLENVVIEKRAGGRWYEKDVNGKECDWGKLLAYDPYRRLLLQWQLSTNFAYDANLYTEVEVLFESLGAEKTKVTLEHRNLENYGKAGVEMRSMLDKENAWMAGLSAFAAFCARSS